MNLALESGWLKSNVVNSKILLQYIGEYQGANLIWDACDISELEGMDEAQTPNRKRSPQT